MLANFNLVNLTELCGVAPDGTRVSMSGASLDRQKTVLLRLDMSHQGLGDLDAVVLFAVLEQVLNSLFSLSSFFAV